MKDLISNVIKGPKGSKHFMSPTISSVSKINPSPRNKILSDKNELSRSFDKTHQKVQVMSSASFSDVRSINGEDKDLEEIRIHENKKHDITVTDFDENIETKINDDSSFKITPLPPSVLYTVLKPHEVDNGPLVAPYDPKKNFLSPRPTEIEDAVSKTLEIDHVDKDNDLAAVEYVGDMYTFYKEVENETNPQMYIHRQPDLNEKMRSILVDWMVDAHAKFDLSPETLYLSVNIADRFLSLKTVPRRELQLVGVGAMIIASKYEEIRPPRVGDLVFETDHFYSNEQILVMEKTILENLEWDLTVPTQFMFLVRFIKASNPDSELENMVHFIAELGMMRHCTLKFCPSMLAASAVYTARCCLNKTPTWTDTLKFHTGYSETQLMVCSKLLASTHSNVAKSKLRSVFEKYSKVERNAVAFIAPAKSLLSDD